MLLHEAVNGVDEVFHALAFVSNLLRDEEYDAALGGQSDVQSSRLAVAGAEHAGVDGVGHGRHALPYEEGALPAGSSWQLWHPVRNALQVRA